MPTQLLTNLERRVIANLSIPRNKFDLAKVIREDAYAGAHDFHPDNDGLLDSLIKAGWVASLGGDHESAGKLAAKATSQKGLVVLPDEKARTFEARLSMPHRSWRAKGEQFIMTQLGFDQLHVPVSDPTPAPTDVVQKRINDQFRRLHAAEVNARTRLGSNAAGECVMLEEEFVAWAKAVAKQHQELTGDKILLPIAGGAGYADATETLIIDPENGKGSAYTETAPWFMAAVTVAVTDADTGSTITEANYTGYARKSVAAADMNSAASPGGSATNANAITFAACTAGTSAVIGFAKCVAATVGRLIKYGTCTTVNVSSTQQPLSFAAGQFTTSVD